MVCCVTINAVYIMFNDGSIVLCDSAGVCPASPPGESLFLEKTLIPYCHSSSSASPIGMALTQFYCLLLYRDR